MNHLQPKSARIRPGTMVRIRNFQEIGDTLDGQGYADGLPFMPEMRRFCGGVYKVLQCVNRIIVEGNGVRRFRKVYILEGVRCDGAAHHQCRRLCHLFWKESWLDLDLTVKDALVAEDPVPSPAELQPKTNETGPCHGQASVLLAATEPLAFLNPHQYLEDIRCGTRSFWGTIALIGRTVFGRIYLRLLWMYRSRFSAKKPPVRVDFRPAPFKIGDWVEVRPNEEIEKTLDQNRKLQGLSFAEAMRRFCGKKFRVIQTVDVMIVEETGKRQKVRDTFLLEDATCSGAIYRGCPRLCYWFWKGAWLKYATPPAESQTQKDDMNSVSNDRLSKMF